MKNHERLDIALHRFDFINESISFLKDEALFLFWSVSCSMCHSAVRQVIIDKNFSIQKILVHMPIVETDLNKRNLYDYVNKYNVEESILLDSKHLLSNKCNIETVPTFIYYANNKIIYKLEGEYSYPIIKKIIQKSRKNK